MNIGKLRHIVMVDRCGSVTEAARQLHVTQSAVTKSVADVEREIGYPLFDRLARGVATTLAGRAFVDRARRIISDMDQLIHDAHSERAGRDAVLRVVICPPSLEGLLNRALRSFIVANPACRVHLFASTIERGIRLLRQGDVDICLGARDRLEVVDDFDCLALPDLHATLYVRKDHPLAGQDRVAEAQIAAYPIIVPDLQGTYIEQIMALVGADASPMRRLHIIENFPMVAEIISATDTIGIVSAGYARTAAFARRFRTLPFPLDPAMPLAMATRAHWPDSRQITQFRAALQKYPLTGASS